MKITEIEKENKMIRVYDCGHEAPVVYDNEYMENGQAVLDQCRQIGCPDFHLVTVSKINWDSDMSPWASEPVVSKEDHFTGEAGAYLEWMKKEVIPYAEEVLAKKGTGRVLAGYSMAGLFSLYTAYQTDLFDGILSASGSVWYPEFLVYCEEHNFTKPPKAIYLSLGNKETKTRNPYMRTTEDVMKALLALYQSQNITSVFEANEGNHFKETDLRLAKGIKWILSKIDTEKEKSK